MRRPIVITLTTLLAVCVAAPAPAVAKQLVGLTVCGAQGCVNRTKAIGPQHGPDTGILDVGSTIVAGPKHPRFIRFRMSIGDHAGGKTFGRNTMIFAPYAGLVRLDDGSWYEPSPEVVRDLRRLSRGLRPLPPGRLDPPAIPPAPESAPASSARVVEVVAPPRTDGGGDDGSGVTVAAVAAAALAGLGGGALILRRRRRGRRAPAITETPATG